MSALPGAPRQETRSALFPCLCSLSRHHSCHQLTLTCQLNALSVWGRKAQMWYGYCCIYGGARWRISNQVCSEHRTFLYLRRVHADRIASMPTLRQLEYLIALADTLHFRRAAERVHATQPTLSEQLQP